MLLTIILREQDFLSANIKLLLLFILQFKVIFLMVHKKKQANLNNTL